MWKGDRKLPLDQQGLIVLGTPLDSVEFVQRERAEISVKHQSLFDRITQVQDLQSALLLLLICAGQTTFSVCCTQKPPGCSLRNMIVPSRDVWNSCSTQPSQTPADVLHMVRLRHPAVAETMLESLNSDDPRHSHLQGTVVARSRLQDTEFHSSEWHALANGESPHGFPDPDDVGPRHCGWQRVAIQDANGLFLMTAVWPRLSDTSRALLRSQGGPLAGLHFSCCQSSFHTRFAPQVFRVLLLRRLWLPLPPTKRTCGCVGSPRFRLGVCCGSCAS